MTKPILRTKLCDLFGIEYPIILAGMGDVCKDETIANGKLCAAVSNAGGLGIIGGGTISPAKLREEIREAKRLTTKPFGVDLIFPVGEPVKGTLDEIKASLPKEHVNIVDNLYDQFGIPHMKGPDIKILDMGHTLELWKVVLDEGIKIIALGLGTPDWLIPEAHAKGMKVISLIGSVRQAKSISAMGTDLIIAQGHEAGGHTGRIGLMALLPQVLAAVYPTPVVAAGGIVDGSQLAASIVLGAEGVWVGTAFQVASESPLPEILKQSLLAADADNPRVTKFLSGKTCRGLRNPILEAWERAGIDTLPAPYQNYLVRDFLYSAWQHNTAEHGIVGAGQGVGMIKEIASAEQIVNDFVENAIKTLKDKLPTNVTVA